MCLLIFCVAIHTSLRVCVSLCKVGRPVLFRFFLCHKKVKRFYVSGFYKRAVAYLGFVAPGASNQDGGP